MRSLRDDARGVARVLRHHEPDVVCLQEAPRLLLWRLSRHLLAHRSGLHIATRNRACGVAVLHGPGSRRCSSHAVVLPRRPGLHRRAVAVARLKMDGRELTAASTHLDLQAAARLDSAQLVRAALPDGALVLSADVNEEPGGPAWAALGRGLQDARDGLTPTFPARSPNRRIDGLWVSADLEVVRAEVVLAADTMSDHLPLLVDLRWRRGASGARTEHRDG